jgi:F0F1-type ATP synthase membrane subunit a
VVFSFFSLILSVVEELVFRGTGKDVGGSIAVFSSLFFVLIGLNLIGLVPYVFSVTSHLSVNLAIALPL